MYIKRYFNIRQNDFNRIGEASIKVKNILKSLNINTDIIRRLSVCMYEGETNLLIHAKGGVICAEIDNSLIKLDISDNGPGIENIELAMTAGYSTASPAYRSMGYGSGMGLPNMKKNADSFSIESKKGDGTRVYIELNLPVN